MVEKSLWTRRVEQDPDHSQWYIARFAAMAAAGHDLHGEARMIDAMAPRSARILDAGCGPGRVGGELARRGHTVVGVDVDPVLIAEAARVFPDSTWLTQDLAELDLAGAGVGDAFDVIVCAGNVMTFLAPSTRGEVLAHLAAVLAPQGRLVVGFGAGRGYPFEEFLADADGAGLGVELSLATWDLRPWTAESDFLVAVLER